MAKELKYGTEARLSLIHIFIHGIVKIASKMGISTIQSYQGSKIFEAIGIDSEVIDKYFTNTVSRIGGITLEDIAKAVDILHSEAYDPLGLATDMSLSLIHISCAHITISRNILCVCQKWSDGSFTDLVGISDNGICIVSGGLCILKEDQKE